MDVTQKIRTLYEVKENEGFPKSGHSSTWVKDLSVFFKKYNMWIAGAKDGLSLNQFYVGHCLYKWPVYSNENNKEAREWFKKAAGQNNIDAAYYLAKMYLKGEGGEKFTKEGLEILESIKDKNINSLDLLGATYLYGKYGVQENTEKGLEYLKNASSLGSNYANEVLGLLFFNGIRKIVSKDPEMGLLHLQNIEGKRKKFAKKFISDFFNKYNNDLRRDVLLSRNYKRVLNSLQNII